MPEGPEVQNVVNTLVDKVANKVIEYAEVLNPKIMIPMKQRSRQDTSLFKDRIDSSTIVSLDRKGKYLCFLCNRNKNNYFMIAHLGMTGAFFVVDSLEDLPLKYRNHTQIIFHLDNGLQLVYSDIRRFGWVGVLDSSEYANYMPIQKIGPDPISLSDPSGFLSNLRKKNIENHPIKRLLLRPDIVAGVGNIYACEVLFKTRIHPITQVKDLSDAQLIELYRSMRETLLESLKCGGSSISDYVDSTGKSGSFQEYHQIYRKKECACCDHLVDNIKIDNRSSFFCPQCQVES